MRRLKGLRGAADGETFSPSDLLLRGGGRYQMTRVVRFEGDEFRFVCLGEVWDCWFLCGERWIVHELEAYGVVVFQPLLGS